MQSNLAEPLVARDLSAARQAYERGGEVAAEASRAAHSISVGSMAVEEHEQSGGHLKAIVFGGLDGILTSFAIIAGSVGANLGPVAMLALGISNVLADALSMGAGEFLSSRSYNAYVTKEREREAWELQNYPAGEIAEMIELFVARGMSREDAQIVIERMAKYKVSAQHAPLPADAASEADAQRPRHRFATPGCGRPLPCALLLRLSPTSALPSHALHRCPPTSALLAPASPRRNFLST